jgi:hypothetical protein
MVGYIALLAGLECVLPMAPAAVVSSRVPAPRLEAKAAVQNGPMQVASSKKSEPTPADFMLTATSRVELNGQTCRFEDVPDSAVITKIVVEEITGAVVTVHFRTGQ